MYQSDYDDAARFLDLIHSPGNPFEVRVKGARGVYGELFNDAERAATYAAEKSDLPETTAVWTTANPVAAGTWTADQKLTADHNILHRRHFFVDGDTTHPKDQNATDAELDAGWKDYRKVLDYLAELGFPAPLIVFTGNGWQAWYRIDLRASSNLVERFLKALSRRFSTSALHIDESVHNPARVGRMPGTMNRKGPHTSERPQRLAKIVEAPSGLQVVPRALLEAVAGPEDASEAMPAEASNDNVSDPFDAMTPNLFDVDGFLAEHNCSVLAKKRKDSGWLWEIPCPFKAGHKDGGAWIWRGDDGTLRAGCHHAKCAKKGWKEVRNAIAPDFDKTAKESLPENIVDAEYLPRRHLAEHPESLILYRETVWRYRDGVYMEQRPEAVKRSIRRTMMKEFNRYGRMLKESGLGGNPPSVSEKLVNSVYGVLTSLIPEVPRQATMPCWLDGRKADNVLVCENGILNLDTLTLQSHSPQLLSTVAVPYRYDPSATCLAFLRFLASVWPDDPEAVSLAQECAGYTLLGANPLQVMVLLQGAPRGGKGAFLRTLCAMVGRENTCSISIRNFVKDFALWGARGKSIIVIPDIQAPKNGLPPEVVEILKAITGNDPIDINGKQRDIVSESLTGKVFAATNDLLTFEDVSGAFFDRLVVLKFTRSFYPPDHADYVKGQEQDPELEGTLLGELPGILNWALTGLQRVRTRQRFTQPASSIALKNELADDGSPVKRFVTDCLIRVPSGRVLVDAVHEAWATWCLAHDLDSGSKRSFGRLLKAACPWIEREKAATGDGPRPYEYRGLELRSNAARQQAPA